MKKKNNDFEQRGIYFRDANEAREFKNDACFLEFCKLLAEETTDANDNLFALRLNCLSNPGEMMQKFMDAYGSQACGSNKYGSDPLFYFDRGLKACGVIMKTGQLTEKGYAFMNIH